MNTEQKNVNTPPPHTHKCPLSMGHKFVTRILGLPDNSGVWMVTWIGQCSQRLGLIEGEYLLFG
jgi:hypothetical protein